MKIAPLSVALTAAIAVGAVASPSMAQDYRNYGPQNAAAACQSTKHQDQTAGGLLGALAGAVIGSNLAAHGGGRTGGALIGAAAGAAVGSNIGVSNAHGTEACQVASEEGGWRPAAYYAPPPPRVVVEPAYYGPDYGPYGYPHHHYHRAYYRPW